MTTDRTSSIDVESLHEQGVGWMGSVDLKLTVGPLTFRRYISPFDITTETDSRLGLR